MSNINISSNASSNSLLNTNANAITPTATLTTTVVNNKMTKKLQKITNGIVINNNNNTEDYFLNEDDEFTRRLNMSQKYLAKGQIVLNSSNYTATTPNSNNTLFTCDIKSGSNCETDLEDLFDMDDLDEDDLDDIEEDEIDEDEDDDDECSTSSSSVSPSHFLTSSPTSFSSMTSSGCSTPTKTATKANLATNESTVKTTDSCFEVPASSSSFDLSMLNEKLNKKSAKRQKKSLLQHHQQSQQQTASSSASGSKRSNRLQSMGYSSDNPAEKRAFHILSERQRRNDLKKLFETLRTSIPTLSDKQKASKLTILKAAVEHLVESANKTEKQKAILEKEKLRQTQLMLNLKALQHEQQQQQQQHQNMLSFNFTNTNNNMHQLAHQSNSLATLLVH